MRLNLTDIGVGGTGGSLYWLGAMNAGVGGRGTAAASNESACCHPEEVGGDMRVNGLGVLGDFGCLFGAA